MSRALVLGGGGPVGIGWQAGLLQGLADAGIRLLDADFVVGTSAGSVVGAQLASGRPLAALVDPFAKPPPAGSAGRPTATLDLADLRAGPGDLPTESAFIERFAVLAGLQWPERFRCTSFDLDSGQPAVWDGSAGVDVQRAVASSCSIPGISPPISIHSGHYIDGGARDMLNADLAIGHDVVLAVSCLPLDPPAGRMPELISGLLPGVRRRLDELRSAGGEVDLIEPSAELTRLSGWGHFLMDFERTPRAFELGLEQGRSEAGPLRERWS